MGTPEIRTQDRITETGSARLIHDEGGRIIETAIMKIINLLNTVTVGAVAALGGAVPILPKKAGK